MAFLDNSGDIILDAVLTDLGRTRMAEGDFKITQFALGDDEIDYSLYNSQDSRGSAYYDIDILNTPVLEAFTDNSSCLKHKLMSIGRTDILYLPVIKLEKTKDASARTNSKGSFYVAVNSQTFEKLKEQPEGTDGVLDGFNQQNNTRSSNNFILLHQGIDSEAKEGQEVSADLAENQFLIEIDNRFGMIASDPRTDSTLSYSYLDDDNKASYYLTDVDNSNCVKKLTNRTDSDTIAGPVGYSLSFTIHSSSRLRESDYLMQRLGGVVNLNSSDYYYIDMNVRVTGVSTGSSIDIPVRFLKLIGS